MQYFNTLPKIIQTDNTGNSRIFTNLMARVSMIPEILKNPLVYYSYDIQDGDTPEIIAFKYYGDTYRYWIVLFANELLDPQWNWPMNQNVFSEYLAQKYPNDNPQDFHHYEKTITQFDVNTNTTTTNTVVIDEVDYNNTTPGTTTYSLPTGDVVVTTELSIVSIHDYEFKLNEAKRNIKILNSIYVDQVESEFKKLMS